MKLLMTLLLLGCGLVPLEPLPPLGCSDLTPVCVCNDDGDCYWQWICVGY